MRTVKIEAYPGCVFAEITEESTEISEPFYSQEGRASTLSYGFLRWTVWRNGRRIEYVLFEE